jgi:hypothetical protein
MRNWFPSMHMYAPTWYTTHSSEKIVEGVYGTKYTAQMPYPTPNT